MSTIDEVFAELRDLSSLLDAVAEDDPRRAPLEERRDRLRETARLMHLALADPRVLERELEHLRRRLTAFERELVQIPKWQATSASVAITDPEAIGREINRRIDEANARDRAALEQRVADIETVLGGELPR